MQILDGKALSNTIKEEIATEVVQIVANGGKAPHLAAILVGDNPASQSYVRSKTRSCEKVGFKSTLVKLEATISEADLLAEIEKLNNDADIDGFIVQLPLPKHIDENKVTLAVDPKKDVDGFHPVNIGRMTLGLPAYHPATPHGIVQLLKRNNIETSSKNCVIVGRSNIVGTPLSILLTRNANPGNCTVTLCHSRTADLKHETLQADILVAAIGRPEFITADMVKPGAVVIDVGINRVNADNEKGYKLVGDVAYNQVAEKCSWITPVPGGVGPLTVTSLLSNTLRASKGEIY